MCVVKRSNGVPVRGRRLASPALSVAATMRLVSTGRVFRRSPRADPPVAVEAYGSTIRDADGREYLDAAGGAIVVNVGHGRREIAAAMADQAGRLAYAHGSAFTTEPLEAYAREVGAAPADRRPGDLPGVGRFGGDRDRAQARPRLPPRPRRAGPLDRVSRAGGATTATPSARSTCPGASRSAGRTRAGSAGSGTSRAAYPYRAGDPGRQRPCHGRRAGRRARRAPSRRPGPGTVAAFVAEPIVGATLGAVVPPDGYWPAIADVCRRHGVLLIADEVMTGFGRTGRWFGVDHWGVRPDILVAAKGATSGYWPFGFVAATGRGPRHRPGRPRVRPRVHVLARSGRRGRRPRGSADPRGRSRSSQASATKGDRLRALATDASPTTRPLGMIRGRGLMVGIELVADRATRAAVPASGEDHRGGRPGRARERRPPLLRDRQRKRHRRRHDPARSAVRRHGRRDGPDRRGPRRSHRGRDGGA